MHNGDFRLVRLLVESSYVSRLKIPILWSAESAEIQEQQAYSQLEPVVLLKYRELWMQVPLNIAML